MAKQKITKRTVDALQPSEKDHFIWDTELAGFGLKVTPSGKKIYVYRYRLGGRGSKQPRITIGNHGSPWTPELARKEAEKLAIRVKQGFDPRQEEIDAQRDAVSLAFDRYTEFFIENYLETEWERQSYEGSRLLRREAMPHFGSKALPAITKREIAIFFDGLKSRPGIAKNTSTVLRKLFNWAESRGEIAISPMHRMALPKGPDSRERFLDDSEIARVWIATRATQHPYMVAFRMMLLTGQRRNEVGEMVWEEVDLEARTWTIPGARTKNKKAHVVPLSDSAIAELEAMPHRTGLIFTTSGAKPIKDWSRWRQRLVKHVAKITALLEQVPLEPWHHHDLRRTVSTGLQRLRVDGDTIKALANHDLHSGVAGRYQRHAFLEEKRQAVELWDRHIAQIVAEVDAKLSTSE